MVFSGVFQGKPSMVYSVCLMFLLGDSLFLAFPKGFFSKGYG